MVWPQTVGVKGGLCPACSASLGWVGAGGWMMCQCNWAITMGNEPSGWQNQWA